MKILLRILVALSCLALLGGSGLMAAKAAKDAKDLGEVGEMAGLLGNAFATQGELNMLMMIGAITLIASLVLLVLEFTKKAPAIMYTSIAVIVLSIVTYFLSPDKIAGASETYRHMAGMVVLGPGIVAGLLGIFLSRKVNS